MVELEDEISRILSQNILNLAVISGTRKQQIIEQIKSTFVIGDPRSMWMGLKDKPISIETENDAPYQKLQDLILSDCIQYFLIDDSNKTYHLLEGDITDIQFFIGECLKLDEYYIVSQDYQRLICETDHDALLVVDLR